MGKAESTGNSDNKAIYGSVKANVLAQQVAYLELPDSISVRNLAELLHKSSIDVIKQLMRHGIMANINNIVDFEIAANVASSFGFAVAEQHIKKSKPTPGAEKGKSSLVEGEEVELKARPPVVTILGHVDHGKTTLLDEIRQTNVTASEVGGITQHIGAYQVKVDDKKVTFLDTPGHEAFTTIRARGAHVTDIAVLVVAADDGVMPQTIEAIDHVKAASVPIVVAINKIDKANANPDRVKQQLSDHGLVIEEWGGDVVCVPVSAKQKVGINELLENILVVAEVAELKANPYKAGVGTVIEAAKDKSRGPLATVLVQNGTLKVGDVIVVGDTWGKVKALFNDVGVRQKEAEPSTPVSVLGLHDVPMAGDALQVVSDEHEAKSLLEEQKEQREREGAQTQKGVRLDNLFSQISTGQLKEVSVVLKTDVHGSIEPIRASLEKLEAEGVRIRVIHSGTGSITESDVLLSMASKAIIIGFNSRPEQGAQRLAELEGVDIRFYNIIYELVEDMEKALAGMLEPSYEDVLEGRIEVRAVFAAGKKAKVAGSYVLEGKVRRNSLAKLIRQGKIIHESRLASLRRFKEDVTEVNTGFECGVVMDGFNNFQVGDVIEFYRKEQTK